MTKRAVLVGIDSYGDFPPLLGCESDAKSLEAILTMQEYRFEVTALVGTDATSGMIKSAIAKAFVPDPEAIYLFYFSGHGVRASFGASLCTVDGTVHSPGLEFAYLEQVGRTLRDAGASFIIILDCCHAGMVTAGNTKLSAELVLGELAGSTPSSVVFAACAENEAAIGLAGKGVFTAVLLDGLAGDAANAYGEVTALSLANFVEQEFRATDRQHPVARIEVPSPLILGTSLTPQLERPSTETLDELAKQFRISVAAYLRLFAESRSPLERWKVNGHKQCSANLQDLIDWFDRKDKQHKGQLRTHPLCRALLEEVSNNVSALCTLSEGMNVQFGTVRSRLGSGTFGTVFLVDSGSERRAYKLFHASDLTIDEKVRRFAQGHEAMMKLDHPLVVRVFNYTKAPVGFYMQYVDGMNLRVGIESLPDPDDRMRALLLVAETLRHAHGRTVIHRDVKPENIVLQWDDASDSWIPYLTDFDLAWFSTATHLTKDGIGTLQYAAPEQLQAAGSRKAHSAKVDSFSVGQLLFFLVTGADPTPFDQKGNRVLLEKKLGGGGWTHQSAIKKLALYDACTDNDQAGRQTMAEICDSLAIILQSLRSLDQMDPPAFLRELLFLITGRVSTGPDVTSVAGKTGILAIVSPFPNGRLHVQLRIFTRTEPRVSGVSDFYTAKGILHKRVSEAVKHAGGDAKITDKDLAGMYSVEVEQTCHADRAGLGSIRHLAASVIDAIERA